MNRIDQSLAGDRCLKKCPNGNRCTCTRLPEHAYHICHDPNCICHSKERYEFEIEERKHNEKAN